MGCKLLLALSDESSKFAKKVKLRSEDDDARKEDKEQRNSTLRGLATRSAAGIQAAVFSLLFVSRWKQRIRGGGRGRVSTIRSPPWRPGRIVRYLGRCLQVPPPTTVSRTCSQLGMGNTALLCPVGDNIWHVDFQDRDAFLLDTCGHNSNLCLCLLLKCC